MTTLLSTPTTLSTGEFRGSSGEAQLAAAAFLARYRGRTLEAYRDDLRCFFQWATDCEPSPGRIASNPAQYVRRPKEQPAEGRGMDRSELARFLFTAEHYDHARAALAVLLGLNGLRVSEACATDIEDRILLARCTPGAQTLQYETKRDSTERT